MLKNILFYEREKNRLTSLSTNNFIVRKPILSTCISVDIIMQKQHEIPLTLPTRSLKKGFASNKLNTAPVHPLQEHLINVIKHLINSPTTG